MEPSQIYSLFGRRVAEAREKAELTQSKLGERAGLSRASIANIEAGRQRIVLHQAIILAEALNLHSVTDLLPVDLLQPTKKGPRGLKLNLSGSHLSKTEAAKIARIVASS
ncbi:helix-turn-helix transcriptional regulator [Qipengyuania sp. MTN3-11]|uniref:helix-turn-helix transcriptional regulator n=1 Tax=Qipengyuania sp. MTN3-11 TaxID=3056557 RepID=UPI0036F29D11